MLWVPQPLYCLARVLRRSCAWLAFLALGSGCANDAAAAAVWWWRAHDCVHRATPEAIRLRATRAYRTNNCRLHVFGAGKGGHGYFVCRVCQRRTFRSAPEVQPARLDVIRVPLRFNELLVTIILHIHGSHVIADAVCDVLVSVLVRIVVFRCVATTIRLTSVPLPPHRR